METTVTYITDCEGNLDYFKKWSSISKGVSVVDGKLELEDGYTLVFGGDCFDKGAGDIRLATMLCDLKDKHPDRVWLLIGNRDANKLRLSSELAPDEPLHDEPPFWDQGVPGLKSWLEAASLDHCDVNRLKWILECTMGAPGAFEYRREELAILREAPVISDHEVLTSFRDSVGANGFVTRYLRCGSLGVRIGDTVFVHGSILAPSMKFVPSDNLLHRDSFGGDAPGSWEERGLDAWLEALNGFKERCLDDHAQRPFWEGKGDAGGLGSTRGAPTAQVVALESGAAFLTTSSTEPKVHFDHHRRRGGEGLMAYQSTIASGSRNVIVESFVGAEMQPLGDEVAAYLTGQNVRRVVVGHRPVGQVPLVVKVGPRGELLAGPTLPAEAALLVICADTSYSDPAAADNRGLAVHDVRIRVAADGKGRTELVGVLSDGSVVGCFPDDDELVGRGLSDRLERVTNQRAGDGAYVVLRMKGRSVHTKFLSKGEVLSELSLSESPSSRQEKAAHEAAKGPFLV